MILSYDKYKSTLRETSKDTSGENGESYMTSNTAEVVNFDGFVEAYFKEAMCKCKGPPSSIDTLCKFNNNWCFIEFKNGVINAKERKGISNKIGHSLLILLKNEDIKLSDVCDNSLFILVYNEEKNCNSKSKENIKNYILSKAKKEIIKFDLSKFKNVYFKDVYTLTEREFEAFISKAHVEFPKRGSK